MVEVILFHIEKRALYGSLDIKKLGYCNPPMGLAYIASVLQKNNHSVKLIDLQLTDNPIEEAKSILKKENPRFVGITCTTPVFSEICELADLVKSVNKNIKVIIGGPHPSALPSDVLKNQSIDFVVTGEGEETILELVKGYDLNKIRGLAYKRDKKVVINPPRLITKNLDKLPFPAYNQLDLSKYGEHHRPRVVSIIGSRGCPYNCIFCANNVVHKKVRVRSPRNVVNEMKFLHDTYGVKDFAFFDEVFTIYKDRCVKICDEILKQGLNVNWYCASRVDSVSKELLVVMKKAGCRAIDYGIESGNQEILNIIKKNITLSQIEKAVNLTREAGLQPNGLFMIGHPYETEDMIMETINFAKKLPFEYATFNITLPLPGTELWGWAQEKKGLRLLTQDWEKFKAYGDPVIELPKVSSKRLSQLQKKAYRAFYLRPNYMIKKLIRHPKVLFNDAKKAFVMLKFIR